MLVEHIILGGNTVIRETNEIDSFTLELFEPFQVGSGSKKITFPNSGLEVKIVVTDKGAMFDFMTKGKIALTNICCFEKERAKELMAHAGQLQKLFPLGELKEPNLTYWLYTIPIDPDVLSVVEMALAKEAGICIYNAIYLAKNSKREKEKVPISGR
jgi:hypothetical protein